MNPSADRPETRLATRLSFFAAGFAVACWAPLVPFAKANVDVGDGLLGLLLLCLGVGSIAAMPLAGWFSAQFGTKPMILGGGLGLVLLLPVLAIAADPTILAVALLVFGASLGTVDVAMNVHAVEVERAANRSLMSGFHALYSIGGFVGAGGMTLLLSNGLTPFWSALCSSVLTMIALALAGPRLLQARGGEPPPFVTPRGIVLLLASLAGVTFLVEGAILDWSALLIVSSGLVDPARGGIGYMVFAAAMTIGRLTGDRIITEIGDRRVLSIGGSVAIVGFILLLSVPWPLVALSGFLLIGLGASNVVPVLFSLAGRQTAMPAGLAVAAVTTTGYAGHLAGPAIVGFVASATNLQTAFWLLVVLMALVPFLSRVATKRC